MRTSKRRILKSRGGTTPPNYRNNLRLRPAAQPQGTGRTFRVGDRVSYKTTLLPWVTIGGVVKRIIKNGTTLEVQWDDLMLAEINVGNFRLSKEAA